MSQQLQAEAASTSSVVCALQDPATGLPEHRKSKLQDVFRIMDPEGHGKISFSSLQVCPMPRCCSRQQQQVHLMGCCCPMQAYMSKHGGQTLKGDELKSIFTDFNPDGGDKADFLVNLHQVRASPSPLCHPLLLAGFR